MYILKKNTFYYFLVILSFLFLCEKSNAKELNSIIKPNIVKVFDGDTILIRLKEGVVPVRLTGIDCSETKMNSHIYYQKNDSNTFEQIFKEGNLAKDKLEELVIGKDVYLELTGIDRKYGRFVGILYSSDWVDINDLMIKNGICKKYVYKKPATNFK